MMKKTSQVARMLLSVVLSAALIASCTTYDPYTREQKTSTATKGAAIGALAGVVVGLISGDNSSERKKRALIMAGVGALAGGAVGSYMDQQEAKLRARLDGTGVSVTRIGDNITLNMPGNITFDTDRYDLKSTFFPVLDSVTLVLQEFDQTLIEVAGHTDSTGSDAYNLTLSQQRAASVSDYLKSRQILPDRLITVGAGEHSPVASNETETGRQLNRRVELTIVPLTQHN